MGGATAVGDRQVDPLTKCLRGAEEPGRPRGFAEPTDNTGDRLQADRDAAGVGEPNPHPQAVAKETLGTSELAPATEEGAVAEACPRVRRRRSTALQQG